MAGYHQRSSEAIYGGVGRRIVSRDGRPTAKTTLEKAAWNSGEMSLGSGRRIPQKVNLSTADSSVSLKQKKVRIQEAERSFDLRVVRSRQIAMDGGHL